MTGTQLGPFEILSPLGAGGMGEVYIAEDRRLGRKVALKLLPTSFANDADRLRRFEQEARATSALNHPNILTVHDIGNYEGAPYIVAELLEGEELRAALNQGAIELPRAMDYAQQIASGLAAAHAKGIIHRDLKPENLFVTTDGYVKILDFGLAKLRLPGAASKHDSDVPTQRQVTDPGTVMGTASYMSPEQARGQEVDSRSDIFSLGVVLYEMIAGRSPFTGVNAMDVIGAILNQEPPPLRQHSPEAPAELQRIVTKALRKDRENRYQHVKDLLIDLKDLKQELEFEAKLKGSQPFGITPSGGSVATNEMPPVGGITNAQPAGAVTNEAAAHTTSSAKIILGEIKRHKLGVGVVLAILVAAVAGLGYGLYKLIGQSQAPNRATGRAPRVVPLTSYPGDECCPSFSPDGNQVAYVWSGEKGDNYDIYIKLIDAGSPLRLTTNPGSDTVPAWSPDGRYLAFVRHSRGEQGIFLVPALGGAERALYSSTAGTIEFVGGVAWSPDGELLAFSEKASPQGPFSIWLLSVGSAEKRRLTSMPAGNYGDNTPAFSPDGKTLAFIRWTNINGVGEIYLLPVAGGEPRRLTSDNRRVSGLAWMPDGREIIYSSNLGGSFGLWRIPVSGGTPEQVTAAGSSVISPAIARQGNRMAYVQLKGDADIWRFEVKGHTGSKSTPVKFIASTLQDLSQQYSADGQRIVFISDRSGSREIWVCQSDGTNPVQVTSLGLPFIGTPRWSPDGRQIAFDYISEGDRNIHLIGASGGNPRRLTPEASNDVRPSWSRDGKWIYFGSDRTGNWQVWKAPAEGGPSVQVTKQGGGEAFESPDGKFVYYTKGRGLTSLWRIPSAGGEESQVLDQIPQGYWAVLEQGIYYVNFRATPRRTIEFFSFATARTTQLGIIEKEIASDVPGFAVSPDGRWILLMQLDQNESDIMLMENFR